MTGRLTLCATPIGNLGDAPPRLGEVLQNADLVLAEDTRRAKVLMDALGVRSPVESYFVGNEAEKSGALAVRLRQGEHIALITDAGMPSISDPGVSAVRAARAAGATVSVVPGPSAAIAALVVSGLPSDRFVFEGFLPRKGGDRTSRLREIGRETRTVVLFAAPSRLAGDLADLAGVCDGSRSVVVARELTKLHEETWCGSLTDAVAEWSQRQAKGEFTLVLAGAAAAQPDLAAAVTEVESRVRAGESMSAVVREVADMAGLRRRDLYQTVLAQSEAD